MYKWESPTSTLLSVYIENLIFRRNIMERFKQIIANIEAELGELREINNSLTEENDWLRQQLGLPSHNNERSLEDFFNKFYIKDDSGRLKTRAYNSVRSNFKVLSDFEGKTIFDLLKLRNIGISSCAIIIIALQHYGVYIKIPDWEAEDESNKKILQLKEALKEYETRVIFKE